jgi:hypothetical protein
MNGNMDNNIYCVVVIYEIQDSNMENVCFAVFQMVDTL